MHFVMGRQICVVGIIFVNTEYVYIAIYAYYDDGDIISEALPGTVTSLLFLGSFSWCRWMFVSMFGIVSSIGGLAFKRLSCDSLPYV